MLSVDLVGAEVLWPDGGLGPGCVSLSEGVIQRGATGHAIDLTGFQILPGIVDVHGDGFERHVAARRGAMKQVGEGLRAADAELAANGITTGVLAQFISWEGGLRSAAFAERVLEALRDVQTETITDLRGQVRLETHLVEEFADLPQKLDAWGVEYLVFNDHLPHDKLAAGRKPPRLNGQALRAGRSPELHLKMMQDLHARDPWPEIEVLSQALAAMGVRMGSHDDQGADGRDRWRGAGAVVCEFPETLEAAEAARAGGDWIVMGAPNIVRGGSHNGNASAIDLVAMGLCDALASDYHYPSLRRAALFLSDAGVVSFAEAWRLVSEGPALALGLKDRGQIVPGLRADLVVLDQNRRVAATIAAGQISFLRGEVGARLVNGVRG